MTKRILTSQLNIVKPRHNLWQMPDGHIVAFGTTTPSGFYWCYNCQCAECQHTQAINVAWIAGQDSAEEWPDDYGLSEPTL